MTRLKDQKIVLGVTGSIAAYKAAELVRGLREQGAVVKVVMTQAAQRFITPLTLEVLSNQAVFVDNTNANMDHIDLARWADCVLIAPATANCIAGIAQGFAYDLLTELCMATQAPIIISPAMNQQMWQHAATQANLQIIQQRGISVCGPAHGEQACGEVGPGRLLQPEEIIHYLQGFLSPKVFIGKKILITAGPTQETLDPLRYFTNRSSGKMGYALAQAAVQLGAEVCLISGPSQLSPPTGLDFVAVISAEDMFNEVHRYIQNCDVFISAAAVADYRPKKTFQQKIKKQADNLIIEFECNRDILFSVSQLENRPFLIGFAAETENLLANAREKLQQKNLDMMVANDVSQGQGLVVDENAVTILTADSTYPIAKANKLRVAQQILDYLYKMLKMPVGCL